MQIPKAILAILDKVEAQYLQATGKNVGNVTKVVYVSKLEVDNPFFFCNSEPSEGLVRATITIEGDNV